MFFFDFLFFKYYWLIKNSFSHQRKVDDSQVITLINVPFGMMIFCFVVALNKMFGLTGQQAMGLVMIGIIVFLLFSGMMIFRYSVKEKYWRAAVVNREYNNVPFGDLITAVWSTLGFVCSQ